ncbi:MAG: prolyl oligopeptidase family serine peptidase, partial [Planctomycetes bacterium]|nr:prolyl oligopeptidase family serine peptidase [Planctomycetota bacterium]
MSRVGLLFVFVFLCGSPPVPAQDQRPPSGRKLKELVAQYLAGDAGDREKIRKDCDATFAPLVADYKLKKLRKDLLQAAASNGREVSFKGSHFFYEDETGKYIARSGGKALFIGLHGGGVNSGSAESSAGSMGGGGYSWIFPEVLHKTGRGWTSIGTEEFVMDLVLAAKRSGKVDPDRIYLTGHSMGGYGTWTIGAHHADQFAGTAAYAGAPSPVFVSGSLTEVEMIERGVLPNLHNLRHFVFQSTDDPQVPPGPNQFAVAELKKLHEKHPTGYDYRYDEVDDRGHAAPKEGYGPSQAWVAEKTRDPRPRKIIWQPALTWKHQFYWLHWPKPEIGSELIAEVQDGNVVQIEELTGARINGLQILVGEPLFDLDEDIVVRFGQNEVFRGKAERRLSTLLLTPPNHDQGL